MSKVLTIGEAMGLLIAEEMGPLEEVEHFSRHVCGAELNYAVGMARLGNDVSYISKVGVDPFGKCICNFLKANGIHDDYVWTDDDHMTGFQMKEKVLEGDPTVANIRKHTAFSHFRPADLSGIDWTGVDHLHVTGIPLALSESCRETIYTLMMRAHGKGVRISFDPNLRPMLWKSQEIMARVINDAAQYADIVMPGLNEGRILTGMDNERDIAGYYLQRGVQTVVIKMGGSHGTYIRTADDQEYRVPSYHVDHAVDTVGAGDGFAVGFTSAILDGLSLEDAARRGAAPLGPWPSRSPVITKDCRRGNNWRYSNRTHDVGCGIPTSGPPFGTALTCGPMGTLWPATCVNDPCINPYDWCKTTPLIVNRTWPINVERAPHVGAPTLRPALMPPASIRMIGAKRPH